MKKQIRLLVENLFDDLYDIDQEDDVTIDVADKIYNPELGEIYYKNKNPIAICCGLAESFTDNKYRFLYLFNNENCNKVEWENTRHYGILTEPQFHKYDKLIDDLEEQLANEEIATPEDDYFEPDDPINKMYYGYELNRFNSFLHIDENGYENTQIIKNNYNISEFPIFEKCCNLGDNIYLPSIDELQIGILNLSLNKLNNKIKELNKDYKLNYNIDKYYYWSSSVLYLGSPFYLECQGNIITEYYAHCEINHHAYEHWPHKASYLPFIKL